MRSFVVCTVAVFAFGFLATDALAFTSLTKSQVKNVCGPDLKDRPGGFGCTKKCADGKSTCMYDCSNKTGECNGTAMVKR